jgi:DNA replication protein DnaC
VSDVRDLDIDSRFLPGCTPEARAARTNCPAKFRGMTLDTYRALGPGQASLADALAAWTESALAGSGPRGLVLHGAVGTGKSALAAALVKDLARRGVGEVYTWNMVTAATEAQVTEDMAAETDRRDDADPPTPWPSPCWYASWPELCAAYYEEMRGDATPWLKKLRTRVVALALDEVATRRATDFREDFLRQHLEWYAARVDRRLLVVTLNPPPEQWPSWFGNPCADRLLEARLFRVVSMQGESLRAASADPFLEG